MRTPSVVVKYAMTVSIRPGGPGRWPVVKESPMERSFAAEVKQLALGRGQILRGEGILAITKALLQSGVSYVGGYPGAPVSHLLDVMADANETLLKPMGVYFDASANEAAAAALLGASINYPMRGAVTWKSVVGTNVAADALSNLASAGVIGGALVVVGEDYGAGASARMPSRSSPRCSSSIRAPRCRTWPPWWGRPSRCRRPRACPRC